MTDTINGLDSYVVGYDGTITNYIPKYGLTSAEVNALDAAETAIGSRAGYQVISFDSAQASGDPTGLSNDTTSYELKVEFNNGEENTTVEITGSAAQTFGDLITEINADITNGTASLNGDGFVQIDSDRNGHTGSSYQASEVRIEAGDTNDLIAALNGNATIEDPVDSDLENELSNNTWTPTGRTQWAHFKGYVENYDSDVDTEIIAGDFTVADTSSGMTQSELEELISRVNAIQRITLGVNGRA